MLLTYENEVILTNMHYGEKALPYVVPPCNIRIECPVSQVDKVIILIFLACMPYMHCFCGRPVLTTGLPARRKVGQAVQDFSVEDRCSQLGYPHAERFRVGCAGFLFTGAAYHTACAAAACVQVLEMSPPNVQKAAVDFIEYLFTTMAQNVFGSFGFRVNPKISKEAAEKQVRHCCCCACSALCSARAHTVFLLLCCKAHQYCLHDMPHVFLNSHPD